MVSVIPKSRTLSNGDPLDAQPIENNFIDLFNNDAALATAHNTVAEQNTGALAALKNARRGLQVSYASAASVTIAEGTCRDDTNTSTLTLTSPLTVNISVNGVNGLDTGTEAPNTWYYVWLIKNTAGTVSAIISDSATSPVLPSGYTQKRLLPIALRNDGASNFIPFKLLYWGENPVVDYEDHITVLSNGNATTFTTVNCATAVPPISRTAALRTNITALSQQAVRLKSADAGVNSEGVVFTIPTQGSMLPFLSPLSASQEIEYKTGSGANLSIAIKSFVVTEVA